MQFAFNIGSDNKYLLIKKIITIPILIIMILIFTEIIELNFCELSKNTKRNINERASIVEESVNNLEKILINDDNDNNSDDNNINDNDNNDNNLDNSKEVDA